MNGATLSRVISSPLMRPMRTPSAKRDQDDLGDVEEHRVADPQVDAVQDQAARDHAAQADDRADRQVDAAGDDDEGHADREEGVERDMLRHQHEVGGGKKVRRGEGEEDQHREQRDEGAQPHQVQRQRAAAAAWLGAIAQRRS